MLNGLRREVIVRLVDIDGIVDHDCLCFLFIIFFSSLFQRKLLPASYLDLHLEIDKRNDFNFPIVNFPFISSNIPAAPAYRVYSSQMIRYSRACGSYQDFLDRGLLLARNQGFLLVKLKLYGRNHDLVDRYGISVSQMTTDMLS